MAKFNTTTAAGGDDADPLKPKRSTKVNEPKPELTAEQAKAEWEAIYQECKQAFGDFLTANLNQRARAVADGKLLGKARDFAKANRKHGITVYEMYNRLGVKLSTAHEHIRLADCWEKATDLCDTLGLDKDQLTNLEVIALVEKGDWPNTKKPTPAAPTAGETVTFKRRPSCPNRTAALKAIKAEEVVYVYLAPGGTYVMGNQPAVILPAAKQAGKAVS